MIVVKVKNRDISAVPLGPVTAGSVGLPVRWYFGPEWDGLAKIAIFRVGGSTGQEMAVLNDVCVVPHELLAEANAGENLFIGVYGRSPALDAQGHYTVIMPTVWTFVRISEAPDPHDVDPEPTPGWEAQLQAATDEAVRVAGEAYAAVAPAKTFSEESEAWAVGERDGLPVPQSDPTYQNNSKYYAEAAKEVKPFYADFGVTTKAEIEEAINGKRQVYVRRDLGTVQIDYAPLTGTLSYMLPTEYGPLTGYRFAITKGTTQYIYELTESWFGYTNDLTAPAQRAEAAAVLAQGHARNASLDAGAANGSAKDAEAWAVGTREGTPVSPDNSSKHYSEVAASAAQSVSQSAAQISQNAADIVDLKSALNETADSIYANVNYDDYEIKALKQGIYRSPTNFESRQDRVCTELVKIWKNGKIKVSGSNNGIASRLFYWDVESSTTHSYPNDFTENSYEVSFSNDTVVCVWFKKSNGNNISKSDVDITVESVPYYSVVINSVKDTPTQLNNLERNTYFGKMSIIDYKQGIYRSPTNFESRQDRVCTELVRLWRGSKVNVKAGTSGIQYMICYWVDGSAQNPHYPDDFTSVSLSYELNEEAYVSVWIKKSTGDISPSDVDLEITTESTYCRQTQWYGKKLLCVGDSITNIGTWVNTLANRLGMTVYNRGVSGTTISSVSGGTNSFCQRADLPASNGSTHTDGFPTESDLVIVFGGVNDWGFDRPFGSETGAVDTMTYCGALHYLMQSLKNKYPAATIIFVICYRVYPPTGTDFVNWREIEYTDPSDETSGFAYLTNTSGKTFDDMRNAIISIASMYGIKTINLLDVGFSFWNSADRNIYSLEQDFSGTMIHDGLHPSNDGSDKIATLLFNEIINLDS